MGQYYYVINIDKKQYLYPHKLGDGLKLMEFGMSSYGTMTALAVLLADGNGRGGGDLHSEDPIIGSWAGDRIVIAGDYADPGNFMENVSESELREVCEKDTIDIDKINLHTYAGMMYEDISKKVRTVLEKVEGPMGKSWCEH